MTTADACLPCIPRRNRRATPGYLTCGECSDQIRDNLAEIRDRYGRLDVRLSTQPSEGSGRSVPRSKSPANDHVLGMTDPRSQTTGRAYSPPATLGSWVRMIAEETGQDYSDTSVAGLVAYLLRQHAHITRQAWVDEYAQELHELVSALRPVTGTPRPRTIGACPELLDDRECGTPLYVPPHGDTITCGGCAREWPRAEWQLLGKVLEAS
jgi:hypothetical protein